jgi:aerobic carbon-monoxide dehydrogenase medium subunit
MLFRSLPEFDYLEPTTVAEATEMLAQSPSSAVLAGGLGLLVEMKRRWRTPDTVVSIRRVPTLNFLSGRAPDGLVIGAAVTIGEAEAYPGIHDYAALAEALEMIHSIQVKSAGTLVGNVCQGTPASDILTSLVAHDARIRVADGNGGSEVRLDCLCEDAKKTCLARTDLVTEIVLPPQSARTYSSYVNLTRTKNDIAKLGVGVEVALADDGSVTDARIALGAVAPTVVRPAEAEEALRGRPLDARAIAEAAEAAEADAQVRPIADVRSTAEYRRQMVRVLVRRALESAAKKSRD